MADKWFARTSARSPGARASAASSPSWSGFDGGATVFHDFGVQVTPRTGSALMFQHQLLHEGCVVQAGVKYVLRTDVMYTA